jgi:hypothetical protein
MTKQNDIPKTKLSEINPDKKKVNPGHTSNMTWDIRSAKSFIEEKLGSSLIKEFINFVSINFKLSDNKNIVENIRKYLCDKLVQFKKNGLVFHPFSILHKLGRLHILITLADGQKVFFSFFESTPPPIKGFLRTNLKSSSKTLKIQISPINIENVRIFLNQIAPEYAPVAPANPGVGFGNRMVTLDYPLVYKMMKKYGITGAAIQGSVFREMIPEKMFQEKDLPKIELPGVGFIPVGHTGCSVEGQFVAGIVYRIQHGISLPIVADADHIPVYGSSSKDMKQLIDIVLVSQDRTLFTLDPHFCLYSGKPNLQTNVNLIRKAFNNFPKNRKSEILRRYENKKFWVKRIDSKDSFQINMNLEDLIESAVRFEEAIKSVKKAFLIIKKIKDGKPFSLEVSIDETPGLTNIKHFYYFASELKKHNIDFFSLAPGLGFTKEDMDLKGSKKVFEEDVKKLASIAFNFGAVLGIHSGDGKSYATRRILARATCGNFWYKISPDRQRNLFRALSTFHQGSFERNLFEDIFNWTLYYVIRLSIGNIGEASDSATKAVMEVFKQGTSSAQTLRFLVRKTKKQIANGKNPLPLFLKIKKLIHSESSDLIRDPNSRIIHDFAFVYVGKRNSNKRFLHRGLFFSMSRQALSKYHDIDRIYLEDMLKALNLID